jgi:hypothetical protein
MRSVVICASPRLQSFCRDRSLRRPRPKRGNYITSSGKNKSTTFLRLIQHGEHRKRKKNYMGYTDSKWCKSGWLSRYSGWLRARRQRGRSSSSGRVKNLLFSKSSRPALGSTQPSIQWVSEVKRPGREADHSPPTSAEVKKMWIYASTPPYAFMA